ncbi:MAG: TauD/TfdA family dioxygenase [Bacteroidota bacterium]
MNFNKINRGELANMLIENGYVYLEDISDSHNYLEFIKSIGSVFPQYNDSLIWNVTPDKAIENSASSVGSYAIDFHSEMYEVDDVPPQYIGLFCVRQAKLGGSFFLLDVYEILGLIDVEVLNALKTQELEFSTIQSIKDQFKVVKPAYGITDSNNVYVRFSTQLFTKLENIHLNSFLRTVKEYSLTNKIEIRQKPNSLLIWDNYRYFHARSFFEDSNRLLKRICFNINI